MIEKRSVTLNFSQGLDTIDDPNQLPIGRFTALSNSSFVKSATGEVGALKKRNGYTQLATTVSTVSFLTNYSGALIGLGQGNIQSYSANGGGWSNNGFYQPIQVSTNSLIRNAYSQSQQDISIAGNGIGCVAYNSGNAGIYQFALFDSSNGQNVLYPQSLPVISSSSYVVGQPKVYTLGSNFYILYGTTNSGSVTTGLVATQVNVGNPFALGSTKAIGQSLFNNINRFSNTTGSGFSNATGALFDATIASNSIFVSYLTALYGTNGCDVIGAKISPTFTVSSAVMSAGSWSASCIGTCFDPLNGVVHTAIGSAMSVTYAGNKYNFTQKFAPATQVIASASANYIGDGFGLPGDPIQGINNISGIVNNGIFQSYYEMQTIYYQFNRTSDTYRTANIVTRPVTSLGVVGSETVVGPELGLGSKPFSMNGGTYVFGAYQSVTQSTYFLINSTGQVLSKYAYSNGGGYNYYGVQNPSVIGSGVSVSFLQADLLVPASNTVGSNYTYQATSPFYTQYGINIGSFAFSSGSISARQTGNTLSTNGGFLWNYDGINSFENNFFLRPEILAAAAVGPLQQGFYQYQAIYQATDSQGNLYRSAPGISHQSIQLTGSGNAQLFIYVSTPRLGYRLPNNPVTITLYRWSQFQPTFYKVGSYVYDGNGGLLQNSGSGGSSFLTTTVTNSGTNLYTFDSVEFNDKTPDSAIVGNEILYTTGNVLEDTSGPSFIATDVWDERLWGISAEDGSIWYSKQLVKNTPVELTQDFALYIPPVQTALGTSQSPLCLGPMDDKQIIFCANAIFFINGSGPDNTGANSQYSEPIQIPSQVGCSNQNSIVQTPNGLMFKSDNGIWLLGRNLAVQYIGKDVEAYNSSVVTSAICVPGTNDVRFSLNTGQRLVYDLLAGQWTSFSGLSVQSSTIYNGLDTVLTTNGNVYQETPGSYLDGATPVTMGFTTGWISLAGLQGYARAYNMHILGTFQNPHSYTLGIAYDYNPAITQTATINPTNTTGSGSQVEQWRVNFRNQQFQSFQLTFTEISSSTVGAGIIISGIEITYGAKKSFPRNIPAKNTTG